MNATIPTAVSRDGTFSTGGDDYSAARFHYTDMPGEDNRMVMDFNFARNPPCAYNPWTTCPLPPELNRLAVRIEAGEQRYHSDSS